MDNKNVTGYICFDKLWVLLKKKNHNQQWLINNGIHRTTLYKLKGNKTVNTDSVCLLCSLLNCQPKDIMEYVKEDKNDVQDGE